LFAGDDRKLMFFFDCSSLPDGDNMAPTPDIEARSEAIVEKENRRRL